MSNNKQSASTKASRARAILAGLYRRSKGSGSELGKKRQNSFESAQKKAQTTILAILVGLTMLPSEGNAEGLANAQNSVVRIQVTYFNYSYQSPWKQPDVRQAAGTGFIIDKHRILTNAHVVAGANTVKVSLPGHRTDFEATVQYIAHDCDLAMLEVRQKGFFDGSEPLELGEAPELNTPVEVIGYPIGGDRVSVTRGVVSRKGMDVYSHSRVDYHMTLQVDAAINPGNSGGPALQNGKVIGVAFQSLKSGENLGYLIPPEVVRKFLRDISDGKYHGYAELGVLHAPTANQAMQKALGLHGKVPAPNTGVYVYGVIPGSAAESHIQVGDVLLSLNGKSISERGDVEIEGHLQPYALVVDNLEAGDPIEAEVWRDGKRIRLKFPARITHAFNNMRKKYDAPPDYLLFGGLLFQPLDANLMEVYAKEWTRQPDILYRYNYFISGHIYREVDESVVLTRRLGDPYNVFHGRYEHRLVQAVNGEKVLNFRQFVDLIEKHRTGRRLVIQFRNEEVPLILDTSGLPAADQRVQQQYSLPALKHLNPAAGDQTR